MLTGTVVVWKIDPTDPQNPRVKYDYAQDVTVYASTDIVDSAITPEIIGRFIDNKPQNAKLEHFHNWRR